MSKRDQEIFNSLLVGGVIGAALGSLLSRNKNDGSVLGALAGAAILASFKANEDARQTQIPLVQEENDGIYEVYPDGTKKLIKLLPRSKKILPKKYVLR